MSESGNKDDMMSFLFKMEGLVLRNIKFFRGDRDVISEEEFCHEVHSAVVQERSGTTAASSTFPDAATAVNIDAFLAKL